MDSRNGIITGFKLFYWKKGSAGKETKQIVENGTSRSNTLTGLDKYTEYEFQVLAFTSHGDGPKSSVVVERTMEDGKKLDCLEQFLILKFFFSYRLVLDY